MRETIRLSLVGVLLSLGLPPALAQSGIPWQYDVFQAQQIAQQEQRLLLLHFYSDACAPCRRLEQNVFPNPEVYRAVSLNYIPVKINGERARDIAMQYQVDRWPTDVITDPRGRILYKTVSPQDPVRYVQLLNAVSADFRAAGPPSRFAASLPPQGSPGAGTPYTVYDNRMDGRSQFAAYPPPERGAPLESATAGTYGSQAERQGYGSTAPMPPPNAHGDPGWQQGPSYGNQYAASGPAVTSARPSPEPREQLNPYAAPYAAAPATGAAPQAGSYDPRSTWSPPGGSYGGAASGAADSPLPPPQGSFAPNQPAWQENRFVSDRAPAETPRVAAARPRRPVEPRARRRRWTDFVPSRWPNKSGGSKAILAGAPSTAGTLTCSCHNRISSGSWRTRTGTAPCFPATTPRGTSIAANLLRASAGTACGSAARSTCSRTRPRWSDSPPRPKSTPSVPTRS